MLYSKTKNTHTYTHTHARTHARTRARTHTHTHMHDTLTHVGRERIGTAVKNSLEIIIIILNRCVLRAAVKRAGRIRVAERSV